MALFNIIEKETAADLLLYGSIGVGDITSGDFVQQFKQLEAKHRQINIRVNSEGGSVFHGIAIFNTLKNSKANIHIYVDGIAASMAAVIALCGKPLHMSRFARIMTHRVSGWASGDAESLRNQAAQMDSMDKTLAEMIAVRTGLKIAEVEARYLKKGVDTWFTADEAFAAKLIDDIYDGVAVQIPGGAKPAEIRSLFEKGLTGKLDTRTYSHTGNINRFLQYTGLPVGTSQEQIAVVLENRLEEAFRAEKESKTLKSQLEAFEEVEKRRCRAEVIEMVDNAATAGKIAIDTKELLVTKGMEDPAWLKVVLDAIPAQLYRDAASMPDNPMNLSWDELDRRNLLVQLKKDDPGLFKTKYKIRFGVEYKE